MGCEEVGKLVEGAIQARKGLFDEEHTSAIRLFNGFTEGCRNLAIDIYARTLVLHNYAEPPEAGQAMIDQSLEALTGALPWIRSAVLKNRSGGPQGRRGERIWGEAPDEQVQENGVRYAVDLLLNRDASFYLDTRNLRAWARQNLDSKEVLNTFAYTGSLGVAALAGGARRVVQADRNSSFMDLARRSYTLNHFPIRKTDFQVGDFFSLAARFRRLGETFDCVFLDPPFFSAGSRGTVDLLHESGRLINKVRPLINDGGWLAAINNALYLSGADYLNTLEELCKDGYLSIESLIPVPGDILGYAQTDPQPFPADPAPFNHPTKIALLRVKRKR